MIDEFVKQVQQLRESSKLRLASEINSSVDQLFDLILKHFGPAPELVVSVFAKDNVTKDSLAVSSNATEIHSSDIAQHKSNIGYLLSQEHLSVKQDVLDSNSSGAIDHDPNSPLHSEPVPSEPDSDCLCDTCESRRIEEEIQLATESSTESTLQNLSLNQVFSQMIEEEPVSECDHEPIKRLKLNIEASNREENSSNSVDISTKESVETPQNSTVSRIADICNIDSKYESLKLELSPVSSESETSISVPHKRNKMGLSKGSPSNLLHKTLKLKLNEIRKSRNRETVSSDEEDKKRTKSSHKPRKKVCKKHMKLLPRKPYKTRYIYCLTKNCNQKCASSSELNQHMARKHEVFKHRCPLSQCQESFEHLPDYKNHMLLDHRHVREWQCGPCGTLFSLTTGYKALERHMIDAHQKGLFECAAEKCSHQDRYRAGILDHYNERHRSVYQEASSPGGGKRTKSCDSSIDDSYKKVDLRRSSTKSRSSSSASSISTSGKTSTTTAKLPFQTYTTDHLKCLLDECSEKMPNLVALNHHMMQAHQRKAALCPVAGCAQSFDKITELDVHVEQDHRDHTDWNCPKCAQTDLLTHRQLFSHIYWHHTLGLFRCAKKNCHKKSNIRNEIVDHYKQKHKMS